MTAQKRLSGKILVSPAGPGFSAVISGEPDWGNTFGFTEADARSSMEHYIAEHRGSIQVVLTSVHSELDMEKKVRRAKA